MKARYIYKKILAQKDSRWGRILVLTGARQTGKTTIARTGFTDYPYISLEDPVTRGQYAAMTSAQWYSRFPKAVLDEIQKEPALIESIKSVYDQWQEARYIMTGSSQLLLMDKVKESLAGRCIIFDIYPLSLPELATSDWNDNVPDSVLQTLLYTGKLPDLWPSFILDPSYPSKMKAWEHLSRFGGYPALTDEGMSDEERYLWLTTYVRTYLERDVRDLANLRDFEPYMKLQQVMALQTGGILNLSALAAHTGINVKTVKRYLEYLDISYQTLSLPAWERNDARRLVKSPKFHYMDYGVLQGVTGRRGIMSGSEFESIAVSEIYKQAKQTGLPVRFYHLRTSAGAEVDLLIETEDGYYAFEIKQTRSVKSSDARNLRGLGELLDKPLLHSFVVSQDPDRQYITTGITAIHIAALLG